MIPKTNAIATLTKIAMITLRALSELSRSLYVSDGSLTSFKVARMNVPPSNSKTSDTVVEVGIPNVLNISSTITSVTMTARNMVITSS